jgi:hypothetical protein
MEVISVKHKAVVIKGEYQFADKVKSEVFSLLNKGVVAIPQNNSNVKASLHTEWNWEPDNITFRNLKSYIREEIERHYRPGARSGSSRLRLNNENFWANVYEKGDYAQCHCHKPDDFSFAYFVKSKWYYPPLVFSASGKRIRPKEGTFVVFPAYLMHYVPKHRYNDTRITLSGNFTIERK